MPTTKLPSFKLIYFPLRARAEATRLAFTIGGIDFEDERISFEEFSERKAAGEYPFGSLPIITIDGELYTQSNAILRYAGRLTGLYPDVPLKQLRVDEICEACIDLAMSMYRDKSKEAREKWLQNEVPKYVPAMERIIEKTPGPFVLGDELSIADLKIYCSVNMICSGAFDYVPKDVFDNYTTLKKVVSAVGENKEVARWEEEHRR